MKRELQYEERRENKLKETGKNLTTFMPTIPRRAHKRQFVQIVVQKDTPVVRARSGACYAKMEDDMRGRDRVEDILYPSSASILWLCFQFILSSERIVVRMKYKRCQCYIKTFIIT